MLATISGALFVSVATVVPLWRINVVFVDFISASNGPLPSRSASEKRSALCASDKMLKHVEHFGVPLRSVDSQRLGFLGPLPGHLIDRKWKKGTQAT